VAKGSAEFGAVVTVVEEPAFESVGISAAKTSCAVQVPSGGCEVVVCDLDRDKPREILGIDRYRSVSVIESLVNE
jgi:hypothetical protein